MKNENSYPIRFIEPVLLKDGTLVQLRPIHPIDGNQAVEFRGRLSDESIYNRFLGYIPKISDKLIDRLTNIDYSKEMAIVGEVQHEKEKEVIAIGRIAGDPTSGGDIGIIVADDWHGKGLGTLLTDYMIQVARDMKYEKIVASVFASNTAMLAILKKRDFVVKVNRGETLSVELILESEEEEE